MDFQGALNSAASHPGEMFARIKGWKGRAFGAKHMAIPGRTKEMILCQYRVTQWGWRWKPKPESIRVEWLYADWEILTWGELKNETEVI